MKKQNKNNLDFTKASVAELNEVQLLSVEGGTSLPCIYAATRSSEPCIAISIHITTTLANDNINIGQ